MKAKILTVLLSFSLILNAQQVSISDSIFEVNLINLGYDILWDQHVWLDSI